MRRTDGLRTLLSDLAEIYTTDGTEIKTIEFTSGTPAASPDGTVKIAPNVRETYGRSVDDIGELRLIVDTLSHEVAHLNYSDLRSKQRMTEENPDIPKTAGMVANILEDCYIDHRRTERFPGLAPTRAFSIDAIMGNHHRRPRVDNMDNRTGQIVETALQTAFAGIWAVKGLADADDELQQFATDFYQFADKIRFVDDPDERFDMFNSALDVVREYLPDDADRGDIDDTTDERVDDGPVADELPDESPTDPGETPQPPADESPDTDGSDGSDGSDESPDESPDTDGSDGSDGSGESPDERPDTDRIDAILNDYNPDDLEVVGR